MRKKTQPHAGRPPLFGENMDRHSLHFTAAQWDKIQRNGGPQWVRNLVDKAKETK